MAPDVLFRLGSPGGNVQSENNKWGDTCTVSAILRRSAHREDDAGEWIVYRQSPSTATPRHFTVLLVAFIMRLATTILRSLINLPFFFNVILLGTSTNRRLALFSLPLAGT